MGGEVGGGEGRLSQGLAGAKAGPCSGPIPASCCIPERSLCHGLCAPPRLSCKVSASGPVGDKFGVDVL